MKDLMKRLCSHIEGCNGNLGEGACRGRMALQFRLCVLNDGEKSNILRNN